LKICFCGVVVLAFAGWAGAQQAPVPVEQEPHHHVVLKNDSVLVTHVVIPPGEFMTHDLENIGDTPLIFATVEFLHSANAPLEVEASESALVA